VATVGLSLAATRGTVAAACHSTCTAQLAECKRTCPEGGQARRDCRGACAERSTCTAPGAPIRTLAYVVSECATDQQGRGGSGQKQKLLIRRGNCDPVTVMEVAPSTFPVAKPIGICGSASGYRVGFGSQGTGVFQRMAVLPDGSGVVFEVTTQLSLVRSLTPKPPEEGIFFVRADGKGPPRRLGDASRYPTILVVADPTSPIGVSYSATGANLFAVSPDGRKIALLDFGRDRDGHQAPQVFLLDLRSGERTQLTHQSRVVSGLDTGICCAGFLNTRTIAFNRTVDGRTFHVQTDGKSPEEEIPPPNLTPVPGAHIVPQFKVTGVSPKVALVVFPDRPAVNAVPGAERVAELFLIDGQNVVQLTNFGRSDTGGGLVASGRVLFYGSANPTGKNPDEVCQLFSVNERGGDLRQLTHLPSDGRPPNGCRIGIEKQCSISYTFQDPMTGTVVFGSSCDPFGGNPFGDQIFAMRRDGSGLRQLTATRGLTTDPDGTVHDEYPGPVAFP
jgi:hypothetical protein